MTDFNEIARLMPEVTHTQEYVDSVQPRPDGVYEFEEGVYAKGTKFPDKAMFLDHCVFYEECVFGKETQFGKYIFIAHDAKIGEKSLFLGFVGIRENSFIGDGCIFRADERISDNCTFGAGVLHGEKGIFGNNITFGERNRLGKESTIGNNCTFADNTSFRQKCVIGDNCTFGKNCTLGMSTQVGKECTFDTWATFESVKLGRDCFLKAPANMQLQSVYWDYPLHYGVSREESYIVVDYVDTLMADRSYDAFILCEGGELMCQLKEKHSPRWFFGTEEQFLKARTADRPGVKGGIAEKMLERAKNILDIRQKSREKYKSDS